MSTKVAEKSNRSTLDCLPNGLVIGPQRAGTTWIYEYLRGRLDVGVSQRVKEVYFFDRHYERGLQWYHWHFAGATGRKWIIDIAPTYFNCPEVPHRVLSDLGSIPIVCTLRHSARRAFSLYLLYRRYGYTRQPFQKAALEIPHILDSSRYARHLSSWIEVFGKDQVTVLFLETLAKNPTEYAEQLCGVLGMPFVSGEETFKDSPNPNDGLPFSNLVARSGVVLGDIARSLRLHGLIDAAKKLGLKRLFFGASGSGNVPKMTVDDFDWFMEQMGDDIESLERLLGIELPSWKTFSKPESQGESVQR